MAALATSCQKASDMLERLCLLGAGVLLSINLASVLIGVLGRFHRAPVWTTDLAKVTLVWMVMLAAAPALKRGEHMAIFIIVNKLKPNMRKIASVLRAVIFISILILMIYLGWQYAYKMRLFNIMSLGIKQIIPLMAIPVGMGLMLIEYGFQQCIGLDELASRPAPSPKDVIQSLTTKKTESTTQKSTDSHIKED